MIFNISGKIEIEGKTLVKTLKVNKLMVFYYLFFISFLRPHIHFHLPIFSNNQGSSFIYNTKRVRLWFHNVNFVVDCKSINLLLLIALICTQFCALFSWSISMHTSGTKNNPYLESLLFVEGTRSDLVIRFQHSGLT